MQHPRLDLDRIAATLRQAQRALASTPAPHGDHRDPLDDRIVANMLAGYGYVEWLVGAGIDVFAMGHHRHLLELNRLALCGTDPQQRSEYEAHLAATEQRFYAEPQAGIEDLVEWYRVHLGLSVWERAAGVYIRTLNEPQLFIEGNHRTGALAMSYVLLREGEPPFVLSPANAAEYFAPARTVREIRKHSIAALVRVPRLRRRLARMLIRESNPDFLLNPAATERTAHEAAAH